MNAQHKPHETYNDRRKNILLYWLERIALFVVCVSDSVVSFIQPMLVLCGYLLFCIISFYFCFFVPFRLNLKGTFVGRIRNIQSQPNYDSIWTTFYFTYFLFVVLVFFFFFFARWFSVYFGLSFWFWWHTKQTDKRKPTHTHRRNPEKKTANT